jgi:hypothetical protein
MGTILLRAGVSTWLGAALVLMRAMATITARDVPAMEAVMRRSILYAAILYAACLAACVMQLSPARAGSPAEPQTGDRVLAPDRLRLAQGQCWRRIGPFATQDTAWQRWREARGTGHAVSNGVVPCYDSYGTRGYCFNIFYAC